MHQAAIQCLALAKEKKLALAFQNAKKLHALAIDQSTEVASGNSCRSTFS